MPHGGESFFDGRCDGAHRDRVAEHGVSHRCSTNLPRDVVGAVNTSGDERRELHRPRQSLELLPEPTDDHRHVEGEHEADRDHVAVAVAVVGDLLERPAPAKRDAAMSQVAYRVASGRLVKQEQWER